MLRERVVREAGGNPLFLRELARAARAGEDELPPTLAAALRRDLAELAPCERALLEGAAVAGDPFEPELAAAAAGNAPGAAALDRLAAAGLVRSAGRGRAFSFRHPLLRRAVYDAAPPGWRLDAHERVAAALERRGADLGARAHHVARSAREGDQAAIALLTVAAAEAAAVSPAAAARWYGEASRLAGERSGLALLVPLAQALLESGRLREARDALGRALAEPGGNATELIVACAAVEVLLGRHADARRRLLDALDSAPPSQVAALSLELASSAFYRGRPRELGEWAGRAAATAAAPATIARAEALRALGALWEHDAVKAATALERAAAQRAGDALALRDLANAELLMERYSAAAATSAPRARPPPLRGRAARVADRPRGRTRQPPRSRRGGGRDRTCRRERAVPEPPAPRDESAMGVVPEPAALAAPPARAARAGLRALAARPDRPLPRPGARRAARGGGGRPPDHRVGAERVDPYRRMRDGRAPRRPRPRTRAARHAAGRRGPTRGRRPELVGLDPAGGGASRARRRPPRSRRPLGRASGDEPSRLARKRGPRALRSGRSSARPRPRGGGSRMSLQAAADGDRVDARRDAAEARLLAGRALAAAGRDEAAKAALQQVAADTGRGGALLLRDAAARELRRLGTRIAAHGRRAGGGTLTEREREIARLVTDGHSNKAIAAALYLSEKTVRNALTRTYAKLGVRSRTQLARALRNP